MARSDQQEGYKHAEKGGFFFFCCVSSVFKFFLKFDLQQRIELKPESWGGKKNT